MSCMKVSKLYALYIIIPYVIYNFALAIDDGKRDSKITSYEVASLSAR